MAEQGSNEILIVNGTGQYACARAGGEWLADHPGLRVKFSQLVETRRTFGHKWRQSILSHRTRHGWKIFPGRVWQRSTCRSDKADERFG